VASDASAGTASLMVTSGAEVRTLAVVRGVGSSARWSPDGAMVAILATPGARKQTGATQAGIPLVGEIGEQQDEQRIAVASASGGQLRYVSPADTFVYEYDWTPDGRGFVATAAKGNGDNNWWVAKLESFGLDGRERVIAAPKTQANFPRVSPDGRTVAFIGGLMSDFGSVGGDIYTVAFSGGEPVDATPNFKGTFTSLVWRGPTVRAVALVGDKVTGFSIDPGGRTITPMLGNGVAASFSAGDGRISLSADSTVAAAAVQDFEHPPEIFIHDPRGPRPITHDNDGLQPNVTARSISWRSDGFDVQGWLLAPRNLAPGRKYPMIVEVHGGPSAAATPSYVARGTVRDLIDHGYFVFEPNPRGSYGQGETFTRANVRDLGGGDLRDILAGVDAVERQAPVDDRRVGVYGHSYGGFMTMWTVTHTPRFKAAVAGAGLSDWLSYYGENGIDQWMIPFFGASVYDDPSIYLKLSPIMYIKNARTPTFIYVGERDVECPAPQSQEFWHGLRAFNVPTSLVIYEGEGHAIRRPDHIRDLSERIVGWFDRYLR
jgi:dipeptidyl aminopeptidase/acylaminoacyl peptidase